MLIVEGILEKGSLWGILEPLGEFATGNVNCDAALGKSRHINPCLPFTFNAPPAKGSNIYFDCDNTPYGDHVVTLEVGWLESIKNPDSENPCYHSTVNGTIMPVGETGKPITSLSRGSYTTKSGIYAGPNKQSLVYQGLPTTFESNVYKAFGRKGDRVIQTNPLWPSKMKTLSGAYLSGWETTSHGSDYADFAVGRPIMNEPYYVCAFPFTGFTQTKPYKVCKHKWRHAGSNTWVEDYWCENHTSAAYYAYDMLPPNDGNFSQNGFTAAFAHYSFVHRMKYIKTVTDGDFRAFIETTCNVSFGGWSNVFPRAKEYAGTRQYTSSGWFQIFTLEPGKVEAINCDTTKTNYFCGLAADYSQSLYKCDAAKTARSNAVTDVPGLESNWIENLSQIGGTFEVVGPLITGYHAYLAGDLLQAKNAFAEGYLAYKYAIAPGISDYHDLKDNLSTTLKEAKQPVSQLERRYGACHVKDIIRGTAPVHQTYRATYILGFKDNPFAKLWSALEKLGLDPTAQRFWDLITLSFVADWFVGIGPMLERLSAFQNMVISRDIEARVESYKVQWQLLDVDEEQFATPEFFKRIGTPLESVFYRRQVSYGEWGSIDLSIHPDSNGLSKSQMIQAGALVTLY